MKNKSIFIALLALFVTGCAGTNFQKLSDAQVQLEVDTPTSIRAKLGKPYQQGSVTKNGEQVNTISYAYASTGGKAAKKGVTAARSQGFYFHNDKLVGTEFTSSWAEDSTDFDNTKIGEIKQGQTTISEVETLLGPAGGDYIFPLIENGTDKAKVYTYNQTSGSAFNLKFYSKVLVVVYDGETGVVQKIDFSESGTE